MALNAQQLIAIKTIPNCGNKTLKAIADYAKHLGPIQGAEGLSELVNSCIDLRIAPRLKVKTTATQLDFYLKTAEELILSSEAKGIHIITYQEENYPAALLNTIDEKGKTDIPLFLFYKGDLSIAHLPSIAVIGSRKPTAEGLKASYFMGKTFAEEGFNIVSGLAVGCDTGAHKGALSVPGGKTTCFLGTGLDCIFPKENQNLAEEIIEKGGLLMSEYPIGTAVSPYNLVARDRLQAGLANATIVIQTSLNGGTLHAANTTLKANKPLFCIKYTELIDCPEVQGNEWLVQNGATYLSSTNAKEIVTQAIAPKVTPEKKHEQLLLNFD